MAVSFIDGGNHCPAVYNYKHEVSQKYWFPEIVLFFTGTAQEFKKKFETPILRGRDASSTDTEHKKGQERLQEVKKKAR
jgi:hypothetical protein